MNPLIVLTAVFAAACAAPSDYAAKAPLAYAAGAPLAYAAAPAPVSVPAPYTTSHIAGAPVESVHQAPAVIQKQLHFGETSFVSGYASAIHKPPTPRLDIAVPTALKGSVAYNAPAVNIVKEQHVVNEHYPVERRVDVPYDVPVVKEQLVEVPVPVHVDRPYSVPHPVPVQGETIVNVRQGPALVQRTHTAIQAQPAVAVHGYAAQPWAVPQQVAVAGYNGYAPAAAWATPQQIVAAPAIAAEY